MRIGFFSGVGLGILLSTVILLLYRSLTITNPLYDSDNNNNNYSYSKDITFENATITDSKNYLNINNKKSIHDTDSTMPKEVDKKSTFLSPIGSKNSVYLISDKKHTNQQVIEKQSLCPYNFKIYVYDLPQHLKSIYLSEEARVNKTLHICQKCILEQFSIEYIIYDFFTKFCGRTFDPDEADFFYLPIIRDAEYRVTLDSKGPHNKRAPSSTEQALLDIIEKNNDVKWLEVFNTTSKYWKQHKGSNHIIVMPAPVTNLRHESSQRGFFHYMVHLYPPIFLALEYSASFVKEYPICSSQKNILMPYPTTDPDLFNGKLHGGVVKRDSLLYYAGGLHGDCIEIRRAMHHILRNSSQLPGVLPDVRSIQAEREHGFRAATFCPVPVGDSPSSKRMYDVLNFGCIPVILSDDLVYAFTSPVGGTIDESIFAIRLPQAVVQFSSDVMLERFKNKKEQFGRLPTGDLLYDLLAQAKSENAEYYKGYYVNPLIQILQRVSQQNIQILRSGVESVAPKFRYYKITKNMTTIPTANHVYPDGGALDSLAAMLSLRKSQGLAKVSASCQTERFATGHKYLGRFPCEYEPNPKNDFRKLSNTTESYSDNSDSNLRQYWPIFNTSFLLK